MNKVEFLQGLQEALSGEVPPTVVRENLRYYDDYIAIEVKKGRNESEVLEELGAPRLIARTIIDATPGAGDGGFEAYRGPVADSAQSGKNNSKQYQEQADKWYVKLFGFVAFAAVLVVVIAIISGVLSLLIQLLPVILVVGFIMWVVRGPRR